MIFVLLGTEWYFILHTTEDIYCTLDSYSIPLTKRVLKDDTGLRESVKIVLEIIVGLLKDRIEAMDMEPDKKKLKVESNMKV